MKRTTSIILALCLALSLAGCVSQRDLDAAIAERDAAISARDEAIAELDSMRIYAEKYSGIINAIENNDSNAAIDAVYELMPPTSNDDENTPSEEVITANKDSYTVDNQTYQPSEPSYTDFSVKHNEGLNIIGVTLYPDYVDQTQIIRDGMYSFYKHSGGTSSFTHHINGESVVCEFTREKFDYLVDLINMYDLELYVSADENGVVSHDPIPLALAIYGGWNGDAPDTKVYACPENFDEILEYFEELYSIALNYQ